MTIDKLIFSLKFNTFNDGLRINCIIHLSLNGTLGLFELHSKFKCCYVYDIIKNRIFIGYNDIHKRRYFCDLCELGFEFTTAIII